MKSRQELIKEIRERYDKRRLGYFSAPWFELEEYADRDFVPPDTRAIEIYASKRKAVQELIVWMAVAALMTFVWYRRTDDPVSFMLLAGTMYGWGIYYWSGRFKRKMVLYFDRDVLMLDHKITIPWSAVLTIHFSDKLSRHTPEQFDVHYLDELGNLRFESASIDELDYEPRQIAAIVRRFVTIQWD